MLETIQIRNHALTRDLDIDLRDGLTVVTGETGAGKSILIGAVSLALGQGASERLIHPDADRAEVCLSFDISSLPRVRDWLASNALDQDDACLLRRVITRQGRNKAFINGRLVSQQRLGEIGQMLIDIHGQHAHHALLRNDHQRRLLDRHGRHEAPLAAVAASYRRCQALEDEIAELEAPGGGTREGLDLLRYQAEELERLAPTEDEWAALVSEHETLAHAGELHEACGQVLVRLTESEASIESGLHACLQALEAQRPHAAGLQPVIECLQSAAIQVQEAGGELRHLGDSFELDPERLAIVERRLAEIHELARKHRVRPEELSTLRETIRRRLADAEGGEQRLVERRQALQDERDRYLELAQALRLRRQETASAMAEAITRHLGRLGMPTARFEIAVDPLEGGRWTPSGMDRIEYRVGMHPSLPPSPIQRAASGGELSRISLAIEVVTAREGDIPTLVFDEVDVGIGGRMAEIVGQHLRRLAQDRQVVCITHLPQVAAQGDQHLVVSKETSAREVLSIVRPLSRDDRREEIARMLGGLEITARTRAHAQELLERARAPETTAQQAIRP